MQSVTIAIRGLAVLACVGLQWASAAPVNTPAQSETPAESFTADDPQRGDIGPARGLRTEALRPAERTVSNQVSTGQKSLDLLLEMEGRTGTGNESSSGSTDEARADSARAARRRLMESGAQVPEKSVPTASTRSTKMLLADPAAAKDGDMNESARDPTIEGKRWSGGPGGSGAEPDSTGTDEGTPQRDYGMGASITNTKTRKMLMLLQEYRDWVIAGTVVTTLLVFASGAASRKRRGR